MSQAEHVLWLGSLVLLLVLILRILINGLYRVYVWFFALLCCQVLQTLVMLPLTGRDYEYGLAYVVSQPVIWVLFILVVLEVYSLSLARHRGIATLARWVMLGSLAIAVAISSTLLGSELANPSGLEATILYYSAAERGISFSLVIFLLLITAFLLWSPVSIRRNVAVHAGLFTVYFLSSAVALFIRNVATEDYTAGVSIAILSVSCVCLALWILLLNRRGEEKLVVVRGRWQPTDEVRLARQLDAVNRFLLRTGGK